MSELHCPSCGAMFTLDVALADGEARHAVARALDVPANLSKPLIAYFRLFEPKSRRMAWSKFRRLLDELAPMFDAEQVVRDGSTRDCSHALWAQALQQMIEQRHKLSLPLSTHGYLLEVAAGLADKAGAQAETAREKQRKTNITAARTQAGGSPAEPELDDVQRAAAKRDFDRQMAELATGLNMGKKA